MLFARPRIPQIVFQDTENFTVYSSTQNLPAVLNDPRYNKRQADFFTRTWGEEFASHSVPPLTLLRQIPFVYFEDYLKKIDMVWKNFCIIYVPVFFLNQFDLNVLFLQYYLHVHVLCICNKYVKSKRVKSKSIICISLTEVKDSPQAEENLRGQLYHSSAW